MTKIPSLPRTNHLRAAAIAAMAFGLAASGAIGQSYTSTTATGLLDSSRWNHIADASPYTSAWVANNNISFTAGSYFFSGARSSGAVNVGNITLADNVSVTFTAASGTLSGNGNVRTITVGTGGVMDFTSQAFSTTSGNGWIKEGSGVLALAGGAYNGGFTLNAGTVIARGVDAFGAATTNVLTLNAGTVASNATRSFANTKYGGGIVIGGNVQFGELATNVAIASSTANLSFANNVSLGSATRTFTLGNNGVQTFSGIISNTSGGLTFAANVGTTGRFEITNTGNTFTGDININGGEVRFSADGSLGDAANDIIIDGGRFATASSATYSLGGGRSVFIGNGTGTSISTPGSGTLTINTALANKTGETGSWTKVGTGTLELTGAGTYTGVTIITDGTLKLNRPASDSGTIVTDGNKTTASDIVINGGTLEIAASEQIGDAGSIVLNGGAFNFGTANGLIETMDKFTNNGGIFSSGANTINGSGATMTWAGGTNTINDGGVVVYDKILISGGTNTVEGGVFGGGLEVASLGSLEMSNGAILDLESSVAEPGKLLLGGDVSMTSGGTVFIRSTLAHANKGLIDLGTRTLTFTIANGGDDVDMNISALITNGGLVKDGAGTLKLSENNTYTGGTTIKAGSLVVDHIDGALEDTGAVTFEDVAGAALVLNKNETIGSLSGGGISGGNVSLNEAHLTVGDASNTTYGGVISGGNTSRLNKQGSGTLTLNGASTFSGVTTVSEGTLALGATGTIANSSKIQVESGATFDVSAVTTGYTLGSLQKLTGSGDVIGNTTIQGTHAPGTDGVGTQNFTADLTYDTGSVFEWDLNANVDGTGTAGTDFDGVSATAVTATNAIFRIVLGSGVDLSDSFWSTPNIIQTWNMSAIFGAGFSGEFTSVESTANPTTQGSFTISGTALTWTAIPEPTSALAGLLLASGLLRRRRPAASVM